MPPAPAPSQRPKINLFTRPTKLLLFRSKTAPKIPEPRITPGIERLPLIRPSLTITRPRGSPPGLRSGSMSERNKTVERTTNHTEPSDAEKTWS